MSKDLAESRDSHCIMSPRHRTQSEQSTRTGFSEQSMRTQNSDESVGPAIIVQRRDSGLSKDLEESGDSPCISPRHRLQSEQSTRTGFSGKRPKTTESIGGETVPAIWRTVRAGDVEQRPRGQPFKRTGLWLWNEGVGPCTAVGHGTGKHTAIPGEPKRPTERKRRTLTTRASRVGYVLHTNIRSTPQNKSGVLKHHSLKTQTSFVHKSGKKIDAKDGFISLTSVLDETGSVKSDSKTQNDAKENEDKYSTTTMSSLHIDDDDDFYENMLSKELFVGAEARAHYFELYRSMATQNGGEALSKRQMKQLHQSTHFKDARILYLQMCEKQKMAPKPMGIIRKENRPTTVNLRCVLLLLHQTFLFIIIYTFILLRRHFYMGDVTAHAVSTTLSHAPSLKEINLGGNSLTERGAISLLEQMYFKRNAILIMNLEDNRIGKVGCEHLSNYLLDLKCQLRHLNLSNNDLKCHAIQALAVGIANNLSLRYLNLSFNNFGQRGAQALAAGLTGTSLKELHLKWNRLRGEGALWSAFCLFAILIS